MNSLIRIVIADDHPVLRTGLSAILATEPDLRVVGEAESGHQVQTLCEQLKPDILLLDLRMAGPPPEAMIAQLKSTCPELKVLIFTAYADQAWIARLASLPVAGYVLKEEMTARVVEAVRTVGRGGSWFSQGVIAAFLALRQEKPGAAGVSKLTQQERIVFGLLAQGQTNAQMAEQLHIAPATIRHHLNHIYRKLEVGSRSEAIALAVRYGLDQIQA